MVGSRIALGCAVIAGLTTAVHAGHEISYYPSFYPQEIRIEPMTPAAAAKEFASKTDPLHLYIGGTPEFAGSAPAPLKSVTSLSSLIVADLNPNSARAHELQTRCRTLSEATHLLATQPDIVAHSYPVTPYHADYLGHFDQVPKLSGDGQPSPLTVRAGGDARLLSPAARTDAGAWDVAISEVAVDALRRATHAGASLWLPPPWAKEGWFQAYSLLRPTLADGPSAERADGIFQRLTRGDYNSEVERLNLERGLVISLGDNCAHAVIGYRLRREFYSDDFSNGIENIASDSQSGFNSGVVFRALKLKDFPWNGWLRAGINERAEAAWNPVAGFSDAAGSLVWSMVGDAAFLPVPFNSSWVQNRAEIIPDEHATRQSMLMPESALIPEPGTGRLASPDGRAGAMGKVIYRVSASAFGDGTEMESADLLYPYVLAYRWGGAENSAEFDPEIAGATKLLRERLAGVRVVRVDQRFLKVADLTFTYRSPVVEVYLNSLSPETEDNTLLAPPWSSVPWHLLALMEAAVERKIAAFSQSEALRHGVPWLDLARDKSQLAKLGELISVFAKTGYRPRAIERLVSPESAAARWQALDKFLQANGHLLVTNGPYRLVSWSPQATVLGVVRDFTYPIGLGTFDRFAYPPHGLITRLERSGDRVLVAADVEMMMKAQRDHRPIRVPLTRETLRETLTIQPIPRYLIVDGGRQVVAAGHLAREADGRFAATLPADLSSGASKLLVGIFLDGNTIDPSIGSIRLGGSEPADR